MSEMEASKTGKLEKLSIENRSWWGATFLERLDMELNKASLMDIASGEESYPTMAGTVNDLNEPDPRGLLFVPQRPVNAAGGAWNNYNSIVKDNERLLGQRKDYKKLNGEAAKLIAGQLDDRLCLTAAIRPHLGKAAVLYLAVRTWVLEQQNGDSIVCTQAWDTLAQLPGEPVLTYTDRFNLLVDQMIAKGSTRPPDERMSKYASGLRLANGHSLVGYACEDGCTLAKLISTAKRIEAECRLITTSGVWGSAVTCQPNNSRVQHSQSAMAITTGRNDSGEIICYTCGGAGHTRRVCPNTINSLSTNSGNFFQNASASYGPNPSKKQRVQSNETNQGSSSSSSSSQPNNASRGGGGRGFNGRGGRRGGVGRGGGRGSGRGGHQGGNNQFQQRPPQHQNGNSPQHSGYTVRVGSTNNIGVNSAVATVQPNTNVSSP